MRKNYKETERAWIETMYLWKKKGLLVLIAPKNTYEKQYALILQKGFQQRLRSRQIDAGAFGISDIDLSRLINYENLLDPNELLSLYAMTYLMYPWILKEMQLDNSSLNTQIIQKQRKIASQTKEIHQRRNWSPV